MIWFLYEKWKDVLVFYYGGGSYLIQARKNIITRKTVFRTTGLSWFDRIECSSLKKEDLLAAGVWEV